MAQKEYIFRSRHNIKRFQKITIKNFNKQTYLEKHDNKRIEVAEQ